MCSCPSLKNEKEKIKLKMRLSLQNLETESNLLLMVGAHKASEI